MDHFRIDIVVREVMNRQLSVSVAKMKLCFLNCFLYLTVFLMLFVPSQSSVKNEQATQEYWMEEGEKEINLALNLKPNYGVAKNVILFVADGMGPNTLTASRIYNGGESSQLVFEKFPHVGILKTYSVDKTVPDSACTATALFSGIKTNWEVAGFDAGVSLGDCEASQNPARKVSTIINWAIDAGKDTGFVTTTRVTHATPAAIFSHTANRKWECDATLKKLPPKCGDKDIARQLVEDEPGRNIKVIMGGGLQCLTWNITNKPNDPIDTWCCKRADERDLIQTWKDDKEKRNATYKFLRKTKDLKDLDYENTDYVLGVFANGHLAFEDLRDKTPEGMPSIKEMTVAAINVLQKSKNGFVLMVEGGLIDYAHHRGYARRALEETVQLNNAIEEAIKMTGDDTLIIVTSDHSHGLQINGYTPGRSDILGIAMNSIIDGVPYTTLNYGTGGKANYQFKVNAKGEVERKDPRTSDTTAYDYSQQTGILHDEVMHGGSDVAVFAKGPMAHLFHGVHEQTYVAYVIAYSAKMGKYSNRPLHDNKASSTSTSLSLFILLIVICIRL